MTLHIVDDGIDWSVTCRQCYAPIRRVMGEWCDELGSSTCFWYSSILHQPDPRV